MGGGSNVRWTDDKRFAFLVRMSEDGHLGLSLVLVLLMRLSGHTLVFSFKNHPVLAPFFLVDAYLESRLFDRRVAKHIWHVTMLQGFLSIPMAIRAKKRNLFKRAGQCQNVQMTNVVWRAKKHS